MVGVRDQEQQQGYEGQPVRERMLITEEFKKLREGQSYQISVWML